MFIYEIECNCREIDWERIRELETIPAIKSADSEVQRDKAYWDMIAGFALSRTYNMKTDTLVDILNAQRRYLNDIQTKIGLTPKFFKRTIIHTADIVKECILEANRRGIDWQEIMDVVIHIDGEVMTSGKNAKPVGCLPLAKPVDVSGINLIPTRRKF